jgi:putative ABC transport system ATP-binding protein
MLSATGQSIVMVTHDKKSALRGSRVVYIKDGTIYGDCDLGAYTAEDTERTGKLENFLAKMGW